MKNQKQPFAGVEKIATEFFSKFTGKHQSRNFILINLHISSKQFLKKRLQHRYFMVSFSKFFRTTAFNDIPG